MNKGKRIGLVLLVVVLTLAFVSSVGAQEVSEKSAVNLEIIGVPADYKAGGANVQTGIFLFDVRDIPDAYVSITYEDLIITGKLVEYRSKDNYLIVTVDAIIKREDMTITSDEVEYYTEKEKLLANGNVVVTTKDALVKAASMNYLRTEDRAEFMTDVIVELTDGKLLGDYFVMHIDAETMEFIGPFRGEF